MAGVIQAYAGWTVEAYAEEAGAYLRERRHPTLGRPLRECGYQPMVELLRYLEANGFTCYIASGGEPRLHAHDHARHVRHPARAHHRQLQRAALPGGRRDGGSVVYLAEPDVFDDGPVEADPHLEPHRAATAPRGRQRERRHPGPALRRRSGTARAAGLVRHDDAEREFDYTAGAETALDMADAHGWTVVSIRDDWATVFA